MTLLRALLGAVVVSAVGVASAGAEVILEGVHWQGGQLEEGRVTAWRDLRTMTDGPPKLNHRLRARLVIHNQGSTAAETLLIRYSMTARVLADSTNVQGTWAIPFVVSGRRVRSEERRVGKECKHWCRSRWSPYH